MYFHRKTFILKAYCTKMEDGKYAGGSRRLNVNSQMIMQDARIRSYCYSLYWYHGRNIARVFSFTCELHKITALKIFHHQRKFAIECE